MTYAENCRQFLANRPQPRTASTPSGNLAWALLGIAALAHIAFQRGFQRPTTRH